MARLLAFIVAGLLACPVQAQNSYRGSTSADVKERFRTDPQFAARYPNFDRMTPGVTPAGAKEPNRPGGGAPPPGDKVFYRHGAEATNCSSRVVGARCRTDKNGRHG